MYTGKYFPSLSTVRKTSPLRARIGDNAKQALDKLEACPRKTKMEIKEPLTPIEPLTLADFKHAYNFIVATQEGLTPKQIDNFLDSYYSHIRMECMKYIISLQGSFSCSIRDTLEVPEPADQEEVETDLAKRIDNYLEGAGKEQAE